MRKFIIFALAFASFLSFAFEANKPVQCEKVEVVLETLKELYGENIFWYGKGGQDAYVILKNDKTHTWSLVQFDSKIGCILGSGVNEEIVVRPNS